MASINSPPRSWRMEAIWDLRLQANTFNSWAVAIKATLCCLHCRHQMANFQMLMIWMNKCQIPYLYTMSISQWFRISENNLAMYHKFKKTIRALNNHLINQGKCPTRSLVILDKRHLISHRLQQYTTPAATPQAKCLLQNHQWLHHSSTIQDLSDLDKQTRPSTLTSSRTQVSSPTPSATIHSKWPIKHQVIPMGILYLSTMTSICRSYTSSNVFRSIISTMMPTTLMKADMSSYRDFCTTSRTPPMRSDAPRLIWRVRPFLRRACFSNRCSRCRATTNSVNSARSLRTSTTSCQW